MSQKQLLQLFMKIDANSDGTVDWDEFMNFMLLENQSLDNMTGETTNYELKIKPDPPTAADTSIHKEMINKIISIIEEIGTERKKHHRYITAGRDGKIKVWNPQNFEVTQTIQIVNKAWVTCICFMQRSGLLAIGAGDRTLSFYELSTGQPTSKITLKDGMPLSMAYEYLPSQGKELLVVGDDLGIMHIYLMKGKWHMCDLQIIKEKCLSCHTAELEMKRAKMMGDYESSGKEDYSRGSSKKSDKKALAIQNIENVTIKEFKAHEGWITRILIIEDLDAIVTSSLDGLIHFHGLESLKYQRTCKLHQKGINAMVWSRSNRFLASCGEEREILVWNAFTMNKLSTLTGHAEPVQELAVNEDQQHLISIAADKAIKIWDIKTYQCLQTLEIKIRFRPINMITAMMYDEIKHILLLGTRKLNYAFFRSSKDSETSHISPVNSVLFNTTFEIMASCDEAGDVAVWDLESGRRIFRFSSADEQCGKLTSACFDDKQRRIITAYHSGAIKIWNFSNGQCLTIMQTPDKKETTTLLVIKAKYSSTQQSTIVSSGWSRVAYVWADSKEDEVEHSRIIPGEDYIGDKKHGGDVTCMDYCVSQGLLVTGASDGTLLGWIYETGYLKYCFHENDASCLSTAGSGSVDKSMEFISFIESENLMITGSADMQIRVWNITTGKILDKFSANHNGHEILTSGKAIETAMVTGDNKGNLKYWRINKKEIKDKWIIAAHKESITCVEICSYKGHNYIISGSMDKNLYLHTDEGVCIGIFGSKQGWSLDPSNPSMFNKKLVPPRKELGFTSQVLEEVKDLSKPEKKKKNSDPNKNVIKYIAPFKQIDLSQFPMDKIPPNYEDLYYEIFQKKLDKKMK